MADFKKLSSVETVNEVADNMSLLIENNGNINKVSKDIFALRNDISQGDWNQNDLNAKNYIQNRTHWIENKIIFECEFLNFDYSGTIPMDLNDKATFCIINNDKYLLEFQSNPGGDWDTYLIKDKNGVTVGSFNDFSIALRDDIFSETEYKFQIVEEVVYQIDPKYIPNLPYLIKVYQEESTSTGANCRCDLSEWEIEQLMSQGTFLYAAIYSNVQNNWIMNTDAGFFYCNKYSYLDDDRVIFTSPDGKRNIVFSSLGTVTYNWS